MQIQSNEKPTYLSREVSPIENLRRLAEKNAQITENAQKITDEINNSPTAQVQVACRIMMIGFLGLGMLHGFRKRSFLLGAEVGMLATIPFAIGHYYRVKFDGLWAKLNAEGETNVKFIYNEINHLYVTALKKQNEDFVQLWNNGEIKDIADGNEIEEIAYNQFKNLLKDYENTEYIQSYNGKDEKISYKDLKRFAFTLVKLLPKPKEDMIDRILYEIHWTQELQKTCSCFAGEFSPEMKDTSYKEGEKIEIKWTEARKFRYVLKKEESEEEEESEKTTREPKKMICAYLLKGVDQKDWD